MNKRVYLVGTNTEIGKTTVLAEMLRQAREEGIPAIPFKPAQSGNQPFEDSDAGRLMNAAGIPRDALALVCPHRYNAEKAPGCAEDIQPFLDTSHPVTSEPLSKARQRLQALEQRYPSTWTFCEGAGGLHVPMPGGTWQQSWVEALATAVILVAPVGLGTINHSLLTIEAIAPMPILAIAWTGAQLCNVELAQENMQIVERKTQIPRISEPDAKGHLQLHPQLFTILQQRYEAQVLNRST